jgi:hypothetical protein
MREHLGNWYMVPRRVSPGCASKCPCGDHFNGDTECHWSRELLQPPGSTWKLKRELVRTFAGDPDVVYQVTLRVRGVVEPKNFVGGEVQFDHFQSGGTPVKNDYNFYNIEVSDPRAVYTVNRNADKVGHYTFPIDYLVTIPIRGGATFTMGAYDSNDVAIANHQRHVIKGTPRIRSHSTASFSSWTCNPFGQTADRRRPAAQQMRVHDRWAR